MNINKINQLLDLIKNYDSDHKSKHWSGEYDNRSVPYSAESLKDFRNNRKGVRAKSIKTNFLEANLLGADYVISKYSISNQILQPICEKCNNSPELFLYKIVI